MKEINQLISSQEPETFVFYEDSNKAVLFDWNHEIPCASTCLLLSGSMSQLKSPNTPERKNQSEGEQTGLENSSLFFQETISFLYELLNILNLIILFILIGIMLF